MLVFIKCNFIAEICPLTVFSHISTLHVLFDHSSDLIVYLLIFLWKWKLHRCAHKPLQVCVSTAGTNLLWKTLKLVARKETSRKSPNKKKIVSFLFFSSAPLYTVRLARLVCFHHPEAEGQSRCLLCGRGETRGNWGSVKLNFNFVPLCIYSETFCCFLNA